MGARGKQSAASLAVASVSAVPTRPEPPSELTKPESEVWRAVVDSKPADWFTPGDAPLLADYCRHVIRQRMLSKALNKHKTIPEKQEEFRAYNDLMRLSDMESKQIKSLATSLRLTQQSRYTPQAAGTATKKQQRKPWET